MKNVLLIGLDPSVVNYEHWPGLTAEKLEAGLRTDTDEFLLFEKRVNFIHTNAPQAKICFNTGPADSVDAVKRWIWSKADVRQTAHRDQRQRRERCRDDLGSTCWSRAPPLHYDPEISQESRQ